MQKRLIIVFLVLIAATATIYVLNKTPQKETFSSVEQKPVQIAMDTIKVTVSWEVQPYTQLFERTKKNRFDITKNEGKVMRVVSRSFSDSIDTLITVDTTLPDKKKDEHSSIAFFGSTMQKEYMFRSANDAPNTFKNTIPVVYTKGDSVAEVIDIDLPEEGIKSIADAYRNQLLVLSRPLAEDLMRKYVSSVNLPNYELLINEQVESEVIPPTSIKARGKILTYTTTGVTRFVLLFTAEIPKK